MSFTVNNSVGSFTSAASITQTISIPAGHTVGVVIFANFPSSPSIGTVTDSAGNTYTVGNTETIYGVYIMGTAYSLAISNAITSVTYTPGGGGTATITGMIVWDVTATGTISVGGTAAAGYPGNAPGTTNGVTTGSITVTSSDGLILAGFNDHSSTGSSVGTGFTQDVSYNSALMLGEHKAVTTSTAGTFTATANDQVLVAGLSFQVASSSGAITTTSVSASAAVGTLTGSGALVSTALSATAATAALVGKGALTASAISATSSTANLVGTYALSATGISLTLGTANVQGSGALTTTGVSESASTVALTGVGALSSAPVSISASTALAANQSAGSISNTGIIDTAATALLTGVGALTGSGVSKTVAEASLSGILGISATMVSMVAARGSLMGLSAISGTGVSISAATYQPIPPVVSGSGAPIDGPDTMSGTGSGGTPSTSASSLAPIPYPTPIMLKIVTAQGTPTRQHQGWLRNVWDMLNGTVNKGFTGTKVIGGETYTYQNGVLIDIS